MTMTNNSNNQNPEKDHEVGYGRPPKHTQFKPGQSGNPKGRKREPKSVQAQMKTIVEKKVRINEGGKAKTLPLLTVILRTFGNKAAKGDQKAAEFVLKLLYAPEYADADAIDQASLSPADQAMLNDVMQKFTEADGTIRSTFANTSDEEKTGFEPPIEDDESGSSSQDSAAGDDADVE